MIAGKILLAKYRICRTLVWSDAFLVLALGITSARLPLHVRFHFVSLSVEN